MGNGFHLAQANVARCRAPLDSPVMRDFVELLPAINALADASHGFVWRLQTEDGDATAIRVYDDPLVIFNMSVWTGLAELKAVCIQVVASLCPTTAAGLVRADGSVVRHVVGAGRPPAARAGGQGPAGAAGGGRAVARGIHICPPVSAARRLDGFFRDCGRVPSRVSTFRILRNRACVTKKNRLRRVSKGTIQDRPLLLTM